MDHIVATGENKQRKLSRKKAVLLYVNGITGQLLLRQGRKTETGQPKNESRKTENTKKNR